MNMFLSRMYVFLSLALVGLTANTTHGMSRAQKLFHATCTGLSYAVQGSTPVVGAVGLMQIAQAKYGNDEELHGKQAFTYKHALESHIIRKELSKRGTRKFGNPNHYDPIFVLPTDFVDAAAYDPTVGRHGTILFDAKSDALFDYCDNDEDRIDFLNAITNHEAGHIDNNDIVRHCTLAVVLPFVTGLVTNKIQAPIKAFMQAKQWLSDRPTCLKSLAKIPDALGKTCITRAALNAHSISSERSADAGIEDRAQLDAFAKVSTLKAEESANMPYLEKLIHRFGGLGLLPNGHPSYAERAETARRRIAALDAK